MYVNKTKLAFIIGIILISISIPLIILGAQKFDNFAQLMEGCDMTRISNNNTFTNTDTTTTNNQCDIAFREAAIGYQFQTLGEILLIGWYNNNRY